MGTLSRAEAKALKIAVISKPKRIKLLPHAPLLESGSLVSLFGDIEAAGDFGSAAAVDDSGITDEVSDDADGIVKRSLGLGDDHSVGSADEDRHGLGVLALFDDQHALFRRPKIDFSNDSGLAELFFCQLLKKNG